MLQPSLLALIHSPLVGPSSWRSTCALIADRRRAALAVDYDGVQGPDWYGGATARIAAAVEPADSVIVVAHSGAGAFAPSLVAVLGQRLAGLILVDAVMPYPGQCWFDTAPPALAARIRSLARDGVLPPWDTWFGEGAINALLGDPSLAAAFRSESPRLPLAFFEAIAPGGDAWRGRPAAYLQLSGACAGDADKAATLGWTVRREALHHLAMLTHPERLVDILVAMADQLERR
jgi:pimeloyl-ACP methyl ester carboxylesterase